MENGELYLFGAKVSELTREELIELVHRLYRNIQRQQAEASRERKFLLGDADATYADGSPVRG